MKYEMLVNFIQTQPMYTEFVGRKSIPATKAQLEKLVKNGVLVEKTFTVWYYGDVTTHLETQYKRG